MIKKQALGTKKKTPDKKEKASDSFKKIWDSATEEIADIYTPGTFKFVEEERPALNELIKTSVDSVENYWNKDLEAFKNAVKKWKELIREAIREKQKDTLQKDIAGKKISETTSEEIIPESSRKARSKNVFEKIRNFQDEE